MHEILVEVLVPLLVVKLFLKEAAVILRSLNTFDDFSCEAEHRPDVGSFSLDFHRVLVNFFVQSF